MIRLLDIQKQKAEEALAILQRYRLVYLAMEERTGKTFIALDLIDRVPGNRILVVTKKNAINGWLDAIEQVRPKKPVDVTNYHQVVKLKGRRFDLIVFDESHNYIATYPKKGKIWKDCKAITHMANIIYLSATPYAQGMQQLYHQFDLSDSTPWSKKLNTFYKWFDVFGKPYNIRVNGLPVARYDKTKTEEVKKVTRHLFVTATRADLGFEIEPTDKLHKIELSAETREIYNTLLDSCYYRFDYDSTNNHELICDTLMKLRTCLHQLEGGTMKFPDTALNLRNCEKIDYIKDAFPDQSSLVIMHNYVAEKYKLEEHFPDVKLLQSTAFAEGIDLHEYDNLVIYSQDFSTAKHTQRRARQCNFKRKKDIEVHHLLVPDAISDQVYKTVSINKKNFVDSVFIKKYL